MLVFRDFLEHNLIEIYTKRTKLPNIFKIFSGELHVACAHEPPCICVQL